MKKFRIYLAVSGLSQLKAGLAPLAVWALAPVFCSGTVASAKTADPKTADPKTADPKTADPKTADPKTDSPEIQC